jgi:glycosyltransferase involved in cell wall biosynthesis
MSSKIQTSLIIPAYNEESVINDTLTKLAVYYKEHKEFLGPTELIVVAAGKDKTAQIAKTFKKDFARLKVLEPKTRVGKGRDVRLGFKAAEGEVQIFMDADLATPIHHLKKTVQKLREEKIDVVIGSRKLSSIHPSKLRATFSLLSNLVTRILFFPRIRDTQCGYKGFKKGAARKAFKRQRLNGWGFDIELLQLAKENKLKIYQQKINDWDEGPEDMRGDSLLSAYIKTFGDVILLRIEAWGRFGARHYKLFLSLSMLASFAISMFIGMQQSVWFDEGYSILLAKSSVSDLLSLTAVDAHPPLYYLILKGWASIFGFSEFALRALSALFGALALGAMSLLIKKMFSKPAAIVSLPFIFLAPFLMRYNFEIRMYSLVSLLVVLATYVMLKAQESKKTRDWLIYGFIVVVGMYTLYMSALVWGAHAAYLAYSSLKLKKPLFKQKFILAYGFSVLLFLPYVPTMISQFQNSALPSITSEVGFEELSTVLSFGMLYQPIWQVSALMAIPLFVFLASIIKQVSANFSASKLKKDLREKEGLSLMLTIFLGPILFLALISLVRPYFLERYLVHYIIFAYALIGITLDSAWRRDKHLGSIILAISSLLLVTVGILNLNNTGNFNFQSLNRPNAQSVREGIGECGSSTIVSDDPFSYIDSNFYYDGCDQRFFYKDELGPYGGYVPLRFSESRVSSTEQISALIVYHLHWESEPKFKISQDPRYELVSSKRFDKHFVDEYRLVSESI